MPEQSNPRQKLLPLRYFTALGPYNLAYLSQLVQRGKLKAKRIGRNYFTTQEWFDEYLVLHANQKKVRNYNRRCICGKNIAGDKQLTEEKPSLTERPGSDSRFDRHITIKINVKTAILTAAVFVLFLASLVFFRPRRDTGQVAGEFEANTGTTTVEIGN